jgi:hypothetical protein
LKLEDLCSADLLATDDVHALEDDTIKAYSTCHGG